MSEHDSVRLRSSRRSVDSGGVPPPSPPQPTAAAAAALNPHRRGPVTMASLTSPPALEEEEGDATFPERSCFYAPKYLRRPAPKISLKFRCFDRINGPGYPTRLLWNLRHSETAGGDPITAAGEGQSLLWLFTAARNTRV